MIRSGLSFVLIAAVLLAAPVAAQPTAPENGDGRYSFHRADSGYLRLDQRTGQVSHCNRRQSGWQCQLVPDERSAFEAEIARLQGENSTLKKELLSRNLPLPGGIGVDPPSSNQNGQRPQSREDAELNRVMNFMERVWRRLVEMIASVQRDIQKRI